MNTKLATAASIASLAVHADCVEETSALLGWMLDADAAGSAPQASTEGAQLALMTLTHHVASAALVLPKGFITFDGAAGFTCIKGKVSKATIAKLAAMGVRYSLRKGGSWSVPSTKLDDALRIIIDAAAAETSQNCPKCNMHPSTWGKKCPGKPVAS